MSSPPPGWYPDPHSLSDIRYWDGNAWTSHVRANGATLPTSLLPPPSALATASSYPPVPLPSPGRSSGGVILAVIAAAAIVVTGSVIAVIAVLNSRDGDINNMATNPPPALPNFSEWTFDIQDDWRDVSAIDYHAVESRDQPYFIGSWNLDGLTNNWTSSYFYANYGVDRSNASAELDLVGTIAYSSYFEDIGSEDSTSSVFTTAQGYEAWMRSGTGTWEGYGCTYTIFLIRDGDYVLFMEVWDFRGRSSYIDDVRAAVDSAKRTTD